MALILLIVLGSLIGWLAAIIARAEDHRASMVQIGLGIVVAILVGVITNTGSILGGLSATALLATLLVTTIAMVAYNVLIRFRVLA